ncbi:COA8 family protein CBG23705, mitochondrial-like [Babylonia areolata]|uniref:COA8 family protein CBG23705, mitochondrial-like n=1 Tax=Babylonia areolata TaxID=304850 RepID=UPI003FD59E98
MLPSRQMCFTCLSRARMICSSASRKNKEDKLRIEAEPPDSGTNNWIGPPDPVSNIRPVRFQVHADETEVERQFRQHQKETIEWNHTFWKKHNAKFFKEKEDFVEKIKQTEGKKATSEELSQFYKTFLNENRVGHLKYNRDWYRKNISLLWPAVQVAVIKMMRRVKQGKNHV